MILLAFIPFLVVAALLPFVAKVAIKHGFIDHPDDVRKQHDDPIPPIGGLVIIPVFIAFTLIFAPGLLVHWPFWVALVLVWGTSAIDDYVHINSGIRFAVQLIAACLLVFANGTIVRYLGDLFGLGNIWLGLFSIPFSVLCICLVINAMNMIDGLDGLCGGIAAIMLFWLAVAIMWMGGHLLIVPVSMLIGALFGFLIYNYRHPWREKASVFLGDSGSAALGLILAWLVIELTQWPNGITPGHLHPVIIAWILALPVFDALSLFAYRLSHKRHPFTPDRHHLHYIIRDRGYSVSQSVGIIHGLVFIYGAIGVIGTVLGIAPVILMCVWIALFAIHGLIIFGVLLPHKKS